MRLRLTDIEAPVQSLVIGGTEHLLRAYDIHVQMWADEAFAVAGKSGGGLGILRKRLADEDINAFIKLTFGMLEDKTKFKDYQDFVDQLGNANVPAELLQMLVVKAIQGAQVELVAGVKKKMQKVMMLLGWTIALAMICWHIVMPGCR